MLDETKNPKRPQRDVAAMLEAKARGPTAAIKALSLQSGKHLAAINDPSSRIAAIRAARSPAKPSAAQSSPEWCLAAVQWTLDAAIRQYDAVTGGGGLALARQTVEAEYGPASAFHALGPLKAANDCWQEALAVIRGDNDAAQTIANDRWLTDISRSLEFGFGPERNETAGVAGQLSVLAEPLASLLGTVAAGGALSKTDVAGLEDAIAEALRETTQAQLQEILAAWTTATGGPAITLPAGCAACS